ncbi:phage tail tube protein [Gemmobacter sp.]|uniref:phage tail tube protein n=1 Tax=Gemmobacter sp. TaxID=1898957 RepID=UPI002AFF6556|nr:phage tail tube protein [Gemmobacter sp.]
MARAHGARAQMALAFESVYGTAPATGYRTVPFASTTLGSEQPLIASELLGQGRDPLAPIKDAVTADGDVVVPIDVENFGFWLKAAFGQHTTSGTTPKTHTFPVRQLDVAEHGYRDGHVGILTGTDTFLHAYERLGVIEEAMTPAWRRRIAFAFLFPAR